MVSEIAPRRWTGEQGAAAATVRKRFPRVYSCKHCRLAETPREYRPAGLGPIVTYCFKSGLLDIPPYHSISIMNCELMCPDAAGTTTKMLPTDDGGHIPATYGEFVEGFSKDMAQTLPPY